MVLLLPGFLHLLTRRMLLLEQQSPVVSPVEDGAGLGHLQSEGFLRDLCPTCRAHRKGAHKCRFSNYTPIFHYNVLEFHIEFHNRLKLITPRVCMRVCMYVCPVLTNSSIK